MAINNKHKDPTTEPTQEDLAVAAYYIWQERMANVADAEQEELYETNELEFEICDWNEAIKQLCEVEEA